MKKIDDYSWPQKLNFYDIDPKNYNIFYRFLY